MKRAFGWAAFGVGYLATYLISTVMPTKLLWHLPVERRWVFTVRPLELGADFYGRLLISLAGGAVALALGRLFVRGREPKREWLQTLAIWTLALLSVAAGLTIFTLIKRQPIPAPLPPGYVAR